MQVRLNKEIKVDICDNINIKYGSVNKNDPQVIYVSAKMWVSPLYNGDYNVPVSIIYNNFRKELSKCLMDSLSFESKHILDFDIIPSNFTKDKKTFCSITFFIRQKPEKIVKLNNIKSIISSKFGYLFRELERDLIENDFNISKKK